MKARFSIDFYDHEGDVWDECILLHCNENVILKFNTYKEFSGFIVSLLNIKKELKESLSNERLNQDRT